MTTISKDDLKAGLLVLQAIAEAIREAKRIPSGHLYATLCGKLSLEAYQGAIRTLKNTRLVREENHLLIWVEPKD